MTPEVAHNFRDKARMKDLLRRHGLPCARHRLATSAATAVQFGAESGYPLVVKPPAGAGAKNTFRVEDERQLRAYLATSPPGRTHPVLLEEFLAGREHSFDSVTIRGRHVFHSINEYAPTPLTVLENPWIQWTVLCPHDVSGPEYAAIHEAGPKALTALGIDTGMTHMEWFRRPDGSIAISEVGARPPGAQFTTLISYAHDADFYVAWVRLMALDRFDVPERRYAAGAAFLRGQGEGKVVNVLGLKEAQEELGDLVVEAKLPKPGQPKASSYEGEGYVILKHEDTEVVRAGLLRLVRLLRVELAPGEPS
jgi:biotin carboxylase